MLTAIAASIAVPLLLLAAFRLWLTARRLDRLHKRTEAAWYGCEESLARRIVAARALAATGHLAPFAAAALRTAASAADAADRTARQELESELSAILRRIGEAERGDLSAELADAEERVALAAQFYNDAVRDTRALRASWFTRFFRLAGHAQLPDPFDMPATVDTGDPVTR
ncbi:MAG: NUDIX hydrolase [Nakamurella sp.]